MFSVGIIGPESTGKSSLAQYLALRHHGICIPEYARQYMEALPTNYQYTYNDVLNIAQQQIHQLTTIHNAPNKNEDTIYFFDTELIITKIWFLHKYGHCPDFVQDALIRYPMDVYLLCYPDLPWQPDPVRENPDLRLFLYQWYEREIQTLNIPYYVIRHN